MYYRDGGAGCLIMLLIVSMGFSLILALMFNPVFWVAVGIIAIASAITRRRGDRVQQGDDGDACRETGYRADSDGRSAAGGTANAAGGADLLEEDYTTGAVDVEVEVEPEE